MDGTTTGKWNTLDTKWCVFRKNEMYPLYHTTTNEQCEQVLGDYNGRR